MNYESWLNSIIDNPIELSNEIEYKIILNRENMDKEKINNLFDCLKSSEKGLVWYNFKMTPIIIHWSISNDRINRGA
tara:strand:- start:5960 stop:6190 length:231 start_codon:yes stop_codon:yes gene_type:complete